MCSQTEHINREILRQTKEKQKRITLSLGEKQKKKIDEAA